MHKPSLSQIANVVESEIELDHGSIEDLEPRLVERADRRRQRGPCDGWHEALKDRDTWFAYCNEVEHQVAAIREAKAAGAAYPPLAPLPSDPAAVPVVVRIVDTFNGGRAIAFFRGISALWFASVANLTYEHVVEGAAKVFRTVPGARIAIDVATVPAATWRVALLHILPLHRQSGATPADIIHFLNELIANGKALADLGLDGGASEAWANQAGAGPLLESKPDSLPWRDGLPAVEKALLGLRWKRGHGILLAGDENIFLADALADLRNEVDELKRALELARAAVADPPASEPAPADAPHPADVVTSRLVTAESLLDHAKAHLVAAREAAPAGGYAGRIPAGMRVAEVDLVFDRGRGRKTPRLIGCEDEMGEATFGRWIEPSGDPDDDPYWRLRVKALLPARKDGGATG